MNELSWIRRTLGVCGGVALAFAADPAAAATRYVARTGSDRGDGSSARPWGTIGHGLRQLASGDTLVVRAGTYLGRKHFINTRLAKVAGGRPDAYTTIRAEEPLTVRIRNEGPIEDGQGPLLLDAATRYVHVDGFVFDLVDSVSPSFVGALDGDHDKVTRSIFRRQGVMDAFGGWLALGGSYNLAEDCAGVGAARYGFFTGGPDSNANHNIFRRCVGRFDYSGSQQPKGTFAAYGNDQGHAMSHVLFQNCVAVDGRRGPHSGEDTYGGYYFPKNAAHVTVQGAIVLALEAGHAGYFVKEQQGAAIRLEHSIAWDVKGPGHIAGIRANGSTPGPLVFDHVTVGATRHGYYNMDSATERVLQNSLFIGNGALTGHDDYGWTTMSHNAFSPAAQAAGDSPLTRNVALRYLLRAEPDGVLARAGRDGRDVGARVLHRYGRSGTLWGEQGFDQLTDEPLWPWPYEREIRAVFSEPNPPPHGSLPATNDTRRGFCAPTDAHGAEMSLTRYVWQYLGHPMPDPLYGPATATPRNGPAPSSGDVAGPTLRRSRVWAWGLALLLAATAAAVLHRTQRARS